MDKAINLSGRMEKILDMAGKGQTIADIGCDHGYVSIAAVKRNLFSEAIAMDINKGPLESAKANAQNFGVSANIDFRLSNGLEKLHQNEADTILIAGMGGPLICEILSANMDVAKSAKKLVLSPQSEIPEFRKFVLENGFRIDEEEMVKDEGKYYFVFCLSPSEENDYPAGELGICYGGLLLEKKHPVLKEFLLKQKDVVSTLLEKDGIKGTSKAESFKEELRKINESMESFYS
ncbi:MAG: class I SAM-dependent methyltransferase [Lachnospiraceae bacterium]|nr:class I SAM-dependent methyltransferase [Lachnospiraceae bacterium]